MSDALDGGALFDALAERAVRYVVIGGFAVIAHGVVRTTEDLDVCPDPEPENLRRLASLLADLGAESLGSDEFAADGLPYDPTRTDHRQAGGNFRVTTRHGALDVMQWVPGIDADQAYAKLARDAIGSPFSRRGRRGRLTGVAEGDEARSWAFAGSGGPEAACHGTR